MENLTFGEQVKIILNRKNMTIKELAEIIEKRTGKKMSRQNLTQRLGRDNFQEQDMRMIASILECPFHLSILSNESQTKSTAKDKLGEPREVEMTIGDLYQIHEELTQLEKETALGKKDIKEIKKEHGNLGGGAFLRDDGNVSEDFQPVIQHHDLEEDRELGEVNPYTRREYRTNSVRMHPTRIGYVQVYDRQSHSWTDMTEWAFLGYQERKKQALGEEYEPPIYLD